VTAPGNAEAGAKIFRPRRDRMTTPARECYSLEAQCRDEMTLLRLTLLGGFAVEAHDGRSCVLPARKARALRAYLALPAGRAHSREKLTALLWGGTSEDLARQAFRQTLSRLRRALGEPAAAIVDVDDALALAPARVWVDTADFETAAASNAPAALERAAELYRGDLRLVAAQRGKRSACCARRQGRPPRVSCRRTCGKRCATG
jgi:two-component SAPR family response regulator